MKSHEIVISTLITKSNQNKLQDHDFAKLIIKLITQTHTHTRKNKYIPETLSLPRGEETQLFTFLVEL